MPLLGCAAMLLSFDVADDAIVEHDDWHTHEHLAERLGIPGFLRGTRWIALAGGPRYLVLYEVSDQATLTSAPYLSRLNAPSPWTSRVMPHYRGMRRGFCSVSASLGLGLGHVAWLLRFEPAAGTEGPLRDWLVHEVLPPLPATRGLGSVHLLEGAATPPMTNEQRMRGADAGFCWALIVTAYEAAALARLSVETLAASELERHGARALADAMYRLDYTLTREELLA